jgi:phosphatidylserine/phosphatidylglycerophosphate/cardiolipin synthase-like enzyme
LDKGRKKTSVDFTKKTASFFLQCHQIANFYGTLKWPKTKLLSLYQNIKLVSKTIILRSKNLFFVLFLLFFENVNAQVSSILAARANLGNVVTVRGVVTNGSELGTIRTIQDGTAGVGCYPGVGSLAGFASTVKIGDSIEVTGKMVSYHNLLEITPITAWTVISSGNQLPSPIKLLFSEIGENYESQLIQVECATFEGAGGIFSGQNTYPITSQSGEPSEVFVRTTSPLINSAIPSASATITGVLAQYDVDYQILPRTTADFKSTNCFFVTEPPKLTDFSKNSLKINWKTNVESNSKLLFGETTALGQEINSTSNLSLTHETELLNLMPGTIYWAKVIATQNGQTTESGIFSFATESNSTGEIKVFFSDAVDLTLGNGQIFPNGTSANEIISELFNRIDSATQTIDVSVYNIDQINIRARLEAAVLRGVRVRYICAEETANSALDLTTTFPVVHGNMSDLMHNKFMSIDADLPLKSWVMSGSMNWTQQNIFTDYNNVLWIQDQSLARTYRLEFEEMWGGSDAQPDLQKGLFGISKKDNTPHNFRIGGRKIECYFSPSDQPTRMIEQVLLSADDDLSFGLLVLTKFELAKAIVNRKQNGIKCRGIVDNPTINGSQVDYLVQNNVDARKDVKPGLFHHKYVVVDAFSPASDPTVETGSHNWSLAAETVNDENLLVIHDAKIALLYAMEFEKRFSEIVVKTNDFSTAKTAWQIYPNPVSDVFWIKCPPNFSENYEVKVLDSLGRLILAQKNTSKNGQIRLPNCPAGNYQVQITTETDITSLSIQKI